MREYTNSPQFSRLSCTYELNPLNKSRWNKENKPCWISGEDVPAVILRDFRVSAGNKLSVWCVDGGNSNLDKIITALAATCDNVDKMDYLLFDSYACENLKIQVENTDGETPDKQINQWHRNLVKLSAGKLAELAKDIYENAKRERVPSTKIRTQIIQAINSRRIDQSNLRQSMRISLCLEKAEKCKECGQQIRGN